MDGELVGVTQSVGGDKGLAIRWYADDEAVGAAAAVTQGTR